MAKFCSYCGKPLEEGHNCRKNMNGMTSFGEFIKQVSKHLFSKPMDTIKKYATEENITFGLILLLIHALILGLFLYCFLKEGVNTFLPGYSSFFSRSIEVPFIKTMLLTVIFVGVGFLVTSAMIYLFVGSLFKATINFKKTITMVGICSIVTSFAFALSIITIFVSINLTMLILLVAALLYLTYLCGGILEISNLDKNKLAYAFVPTLCVTGFVVVYILPKILSK